MRPPGWRSTKTSPTPRVSKGRSPLSSSATASARCSSRARRESRKSSAASRRHVPHRICLARASPQPFDRRGQPRRVFRAPGCARGVLGRPSERPRRTRSRSRRHLARRHFGRALRGADQLPQPRGQEDRRPVAAGVHGLSNHLLDTPWPKVEKAKLNLAALLDRPFDSEAAFRLLDDAERAPGGELPSTGVSLELEERLSAIRILAVGGYGTRCSTTLSLGEGGRIEFHERSYREDGAESGKVGYRLTVEAGKARASSRRAQSPPPKTPLPAR